MGIVVIPAVDIKGGRAVRLSQGDYEKETRYFDDPLTAAEKWVGMGAERLHLVDLEAAASGSPVNKREIRRIIEGCGVPVEVGGGIRGMVEVEEYLSIGARWVILGTAAVEDRDFVLEALTKFPDRIILGIDAKDGMVKTRGWLDESKISAIELVGSYSLMGVSAIIYTDIARDGVGTGVNITATRELARKGQIPIIASGGVKDIEDIEAVSDVEGDGIIGVIVGRAIYEGTLDLKEAIEKANKR